MSEVPLCCVLISVALFERDRLQGYLAHEKTPTPIRLPSGPRHRPTVGSQVQAYCRVQGLKFEVQGYLAHKKPHPPRNLQ